MKRESEMKRERERTPSAIALPGVESEDQRERARARAPLFGNNILGRGALTSWFYRGRRTSTGGGRERGRLGLG